jgi:hypothetical protein
MEHYLNVTVSLFHMFLWRLFREGNSITLPEAVWALPELNGAPAPR